MENGSLRGITMSQRPSTRPSKTQEWPVEHGRLTLHLKPSDRVLFRKVTNRGLPESVGSAHQGKKCTVITGHKEVEGLQEAEKSGPIEMFIGESMEVSDQDQVLSCVADSRGLLSSVGLPLAGNDITIILHLQEPEEVKKGLDQEEKIKKLKSKINRVQAELDRLTEKLKTLAILCEPVDLPKGELEHIHYFCGNKETPTDLQEHEIQSASFIDKCRLI